jgi:hypothetical protein
MPESNEKPAGTPDFDAGALSAAGSAKLHGDPECLILGRISQLGSSTGDPQFRLNDLGTKLGPMIPDAEPPNIESRLAALEASHAFLSGFSMGADGRFNAIETALNELREIVATTAHTHG